MPRRAPNRATPPATRVARVAFLERKAAIERELDRGFTLSDIHGALDLEPHFGYVQFTRYVRRYFPGSPQLYKRSPANPVQAASPQVTPLPVPADAEVDVPPPPPPEPVVRKGFVMSPRSNPKII